MVYLSMPSMTNMLCSAIVIVHVMPLLSGIYPSNYLLLLRLQGRLQTLPSGSQTSIARLPGNFKFDYDRIIAVNNLDNQVNENPVLRSLVAVLGL